MNAARPDAHHGLRHHVKRALVAADAVWIRSLNLIRPARARAILMDVRNRIGFAAQAPVIAELTSRGQSHVHVTSGSVSRQWLRDSFAHFGLDQRLIVSPREAAYRHYDVVVITESPSVRVWRRHPVLYLDHGSSFGNLPFPYAFEFLMDNTADFVACLAAAEREHATQLLEPGLLDRLVVVGAPKLDALAKGHYDRAAFLGSLGLNPQQPTVLLTSHWRTESLYRSADLTKLAAFFGTCPVNLVVTGHAGLFDIVNSDASGGVDWHQELAGLFSGDNMRLVHGQIDNTALLGSADLLVGDHSSMHLEFATLYRPMILYKHPNLSFSDEGMLRRLQATAMMVDSAEAIPPLVERALSNLSVDEGARRELLEYSFAYLGRSAARVADVVEHIATHGGLPS